MDQAQRTRFLADIIRDLDTFAGNFEQFGYRFIERYRPAPWTHRGTSVTGSPVGYTVDSFAAGGTLAVEYSAEKNYFGDLTKLEKDVVHVFSKFPHAKQVWLLSSRVATGGELTAAISVVRNHPSVVAAGAQVEVLDSRSIADFILDNLADQSFIERIAGYLPFLSRIHNEWALSHQVPLIEGYVARPVEEKAVVTRMKTDRVVIVAGLSGVGKSALAAAVANQERGNFELVLWLNAAELTSVEQLRVVDAFGNGERENILGLLKSRRCMIVLDDTVSDDLPRRVLDASGPICCVLATSQVASRGQDVFTLDLVDVATARTILQRDLPPCPPEVFERIWDAVGGHPLLLNILHGVVREEGGDWQIAATLCADAHHLEDDARHRVCDRILNRHANALRKEFEFVAWCGTSIIDARLMAEVCGTAVARALKRRQFLAGEAPGTVHIHDLVFRSVQSVMPCPPLRAAEFAERLARLIERSLGDERRERLWLQRVARLHRPLLATQLRNEALSASARAAFQYAYCLARHATTDVGLLGDPLADAARLTSAGFVAEIDVRAVIETIETLFSLTKQREGRVAAVARHAAYLLAFRDLARIPHLSPEMVRDIELHRAKALLWAGKKGEALSALRSLVATHPDYAAAHVQLGRLLLDEANGKTGPAMDAAVEAFNAVLAQAASTVTVTLAAFEFLRRVDTARTVALLRLHESRLLADLREAAAAGLEQPFGVVAALSTVLWYHAPDLLESFFNALPSRAVAFDDDHALFAWAQVQKNVAKTHLERDPHSERAADLLREARATYEQLERPSERELVQYAECLIVSGTPRDALAVLARTTDRSPFWHHRSAQAHCALGNLAAARDAIDQALTGTYAPTFEATFLHERWLIRRKLGDSAAIEDLNRAVVVCQPGRYCDQLVYELASVEAAAKTT